MDKLARTRAGRGCDTPRRARWFLVSSLAAVTALCLPVYAVDGPFVGIDLGVSRPTNANYHAHANEGATANPFVGYMFNQYLGLQGQVHATFQTPDNDHRGFPGENQTTTLVGATLGPRIGIPFDENFDLYATFQAGGFTGLSGTLRETAPGFSTGAGLNYHLTPQVEVGLFGRWNRIYMAPRPTHLSNLVPEQQGPTDAQFATGGISLTYFLNGPEAAAPPPPPPAVKVEAPPPAPPSKKRIVLRAVHFDFDKAKIRSDAVPILDEAASILKEEGTVGVIVAGHTDGIGTEEYNLKLSKRRADAVSKYLIDHGVSASRIKAEGFGKSKPVASNDTDDGRAQNRRVELSVD
jgi:outer membrane protein OmpA-like peptidoglycan-associated protein